MVSVRWPEGKPGRGVGHLSPGEVLGLLLGTFSTIKLSLADLRCSPESHGVSAVYSS